MRQHALGSILCGTFMIMGCAGEHDLASTEGDAIGSSAEPLNTSSGEEARAWVHLSTGAGFQYQSSLQTFADFWDTQKWLAGDFNGDGKADLVNLYGDGGRAKAWLHLSTGAGFQHRSRLQTLADFSNTQKWLAGDFNGDGKDDLVNVYGDGGQAQAWLHLSTRSGFQHRSRLQTLAGFSDTQKWLAGDFNGDGKDDLVNVYGDNGQAQVWVHLSTGAGFQDQSSLQAFAGFSVIQKWLAGDFNGDGKDDLVNLYNEDGRAQAWVHLSTGAGFEHQSSLQAFEGFWNAQKWLAGDFDNDGKNDLVNVHGMAILPTIENGTTFSGGNIGRSVDLFGYHTTPNTDLIIQVLEHGRWTTIADTSTSDTPSLVWDAHLDLYEWRVDDIVLVPGASAAARWPESGLATVRVMASADPEAGDLVPAFSFDARDCMSLQRNLGASFSDALSACSSHNAGVLTLVDTDNASGDVPLPNAPFLSRKQTAIDQATEYYQAVGALTPTGQPTPERGTFAAWKATNGFPAGEIVATYYNRGDLGFGRDMHCRTTSYGKACYVTNYGTIDDGLADLENGTALNDAIAHRNPGATVAMEWHRDAAADENPVRFFVYDTARGRGGALLTAVQLDSNPTAQAVPGVCMACHGGTFASNPARVIGAQLLPFDVESFAYHDSLPMVRQEAAFYELNRMVRDTVPGSTTAALIDGWYPTPGAFDGSFVPQGWRDSKQSEALYKYVYRPYCQTCHTAQSNAPKTFDALLAYGPEVMSQTCGTNIQMPHAEVTFKSFWQSSARAHLLGAIDDGYPCNGN